MNLRKLESKNLRKTTKIPSVTKINGDVEKGTEVESSTGEVTDAKSEERNSEFTPDALSEAWKEFASIRRKSGKAQEQHIFVQPYELAEDGTTILLELNNAIQEPILEEIKSDLVQFLRNRLENDHIMIESHLKKENGKKLLYTNKEKLDHLAEKNPLVKELQTKLGLDPEF
jgi:DNA polymerase-3 subunit gamma/tau